MEVWEASIRRQLEIEVIMDDLLVGNTVSNRKRTVSGDFYMGGKRAYINYVIAMCCQLKYMTLWNNGKKL